jgi:penicillin amidase
VEPQDETSAQAKELLLGWNGEMDAAQVEPTIYSACRDALLKEILEHNLGPKLADEAWHPADRGLGSFGNRLKARIVSMMESDDHSLLASGDDWPAAMSRALGRGVESLRQRLGDNLEEWRWEKVHQARPRHTLSAAYPEVSELLDPPPVPANGDGDTPLAGGYAPADLATITSLSVARYAYDFADWDNSLWVVPLGSSGHPGSKHYSDQSDLWRQVQMAPMLYSWERIAAECESTQRLEPA